MPVKGNEKNIFTAIRQILYTNKDRKDVIEALNNPRSTSRRVLVDDKNKGIVKDSAQDLIEEYKKLFPDINYKATVNENKGTCTNFSNYLKKAEK